LDRPPDGSRRPIGIITPYAAQRRRLSALTADLDLAPWVLAGSVHTFQGSEADLVILDLVLDEPAQSAWMTSKEEAAELAQRRLLNVAITRAREKLVVLGSSAWLRSHAHTGSALGELWNLLQRVPCQPIEALFGDDFVNRVDARRVPEGWPLPRTDGRALTFSMLDERSFSPQLACDLADAQEQVIGLMACVSEYRWPQVHPSFVEAIERGVRVTMIVPELSRAVDASYANEVYENLRGLGASVIEAHGLHGKDIIIDRRVIYTGSLNWAGNRGTSEVAWRIAGGTSAARFADGLQERYLGAASFLEDRTPRLCPTCGSPLKLVNMGHQRFDWDKQPLKLTCAAVRGHYFADLDKRPPLKRPPACVVDNTLEYLKVPRGRGFVWRCPKRHTRCHDVTYVRGDAEEPQIGVPDSLGL
jgi:hypothetical protein